MFEGDAGLPTIEQASKAEAIANTSRYGKSTIDAIYQGGDFFAQFQCMEYRAGSIAAWWPFGAMGVMGVIGRLYFAMSAPLVFTAVAGTPAAATPATVTAAQAILAPGFNTKLLYGPTLRKVPIRQILLPYTSGSVIWFSQT